MKSQRKLELTGTGADWYHVGTLFADIDTYWSELSSFASFSPKIRRGGCVAQRFESTDKSSTVEIVYNEHEDQAEFARYNRYRYIYIRASTKTFNYGIWGVKKGIIVCK